MRTLSHYFVARYLRLFAGILLASTLAVTVIELLLNYEDVAGQDAGASGILSRLFLRIPSYYLGDLIPIAAFTAAFFCLGLGARWLELLAVRAAGISPHRIALPILLTASLLAIATFALNEVVVAAKARGLIGDSGRSGQATQLRRGAFWYHIAGSIYNVEMADPETNSLRGVEIFQRNERGRLVAHIEADEAQLGPDGSWRLRGAHVRRFDPQAPERPSESMHGDLTLQIDQDRASIFERSDAASLPIRQLAEYIALRRAGADGAELGIGERASLERLRAGLHRRLSAPLLTLLFTLLAIPIALRIEPGRDLGMAAVWGVVTIGAFFMARNLADTVASEGVIPSVLATWTVIAAFGAWAMAGLLRAAR